MSKAVVGLVSLLLVGCSSEGAWVGTYDVKGTWKLNGPFESGKSMGDSMRDVLLDELAGALPMPSFVEDKVRSWLAGNIGETIKSTVDNAMPPSLAPGGDAHLLLTQTLAGVEVDSSLVLSGDEEGDLKGSETISKLRFTVKGQTYTVDAKDLSPQGISAAWKGEESSLGSLSIDQHGVKIGYGNLVKKVLEAGLEASALSDLLDLLSQIYNCKVIVLAIVGSGSGLAISVLGWSHTIGSDDLESVCSSAFSSLENKVLGLFELDGAVKVGGGVSWQDDAGTLRLQSKPGFGGTLGPLPGALAPKVEVSFTGQRRAVVR